VGAVEGERVDDPQPASTTAAMREMTTGRLTAMNIGQSLPTVRLRSPSFAVV
jgi:hypothetical protein